MANKGKKTKGAQVRDHSSTSGARSSSTSRTLSISRSESIPPSTSQGENESQSITHAGIYVPCQDKIIYIYLYFNWCYFLLFL